MKFYLAAAMADAYKVHELGEVLVSLGHKWTFNWSTMDVGKDWDQSLRQEIAEKEIDGVRQADIVIALLPGGRGMHAEIGAALVLKKPVLLVSEVEPKFSLFYEHKLVKKITGDNLICRVIEELKEV